MKRSFKETGILTLTADIFTVVRGFYKPDSLMDILNFALVNKETEREIHKILPGWIDSVCFAMDNLESMTNLSKCFREARALRDYLGSFRISYRTLYFNWFGERECPSGPTKEYLDGFLELVKEAVRYQHVIKKYHARCVKPTYATTLPLKDLFFYDSAKGSVISLEKMPDLGILKFPPEKEMTNILKNLILANTVKPIARLALAGMERGYENIKSIYCDILRSTGIHLIKEKPKATSHLSDVMLGEVYLFSEANEARRICNNLYTCFLPKNCTKEKEEIILLYAKSIDRFMKIRGVLEF